MSLAAKCICHHSPSGFCIGVPDCMYKDAIEIIEEYDRMSTSFLTQETQYIDKKFAIKAIAELQLKLTERDKKIIDLQTGIEIGQDMIDEFKDEIKKLNEIIDLKENERKEWADMCIKKQESIERLKNELSEYTRPHGKMGMK